MMPIATRGRLSQAAILEVAKDFKIAQYFSHPSPSILASTGVTISFAMQPDMKEPRRGKIPVLDITNADFIPEPGR